MDVMIRSWSSRSSSGREAAVIRLGGPSHEHEAAAGISRCCCGAVKTSQWKVRAAWNCLLRATGLAQRRRRGGYYDAYTYSLNFERGAPWDGDDEEEAEVEILSRSFSMRFADPTTSRFYQTSS